jgi:hypothetical protein
MGIFFDHSLEQTVKIQAEVIQSLQKENAHLTKELIHCLKHCKPHPTPRPVKLVISFHNNKNPSQMSLELKTGQSSVGTLSLAYQDDPTNTPIPGVTFTNVTAASDNESVATVTPNADATVTANGVGSGNANATINAIGSFSDASGARSEAVTGIEQITVDAVPPPPRPVKLMVSWSTPV